MAYTIEFPATACYSDYKVADEPSTFTKLYLFGPIFNDNASDWITRDYIDTMLQNLEFFEIIPKLNDLDSLSEKITTYILDNTKEVNKSKQECVPFISGCNLPCSDNILYYSGERCPVSWYKSIEYI